MPVPIDLWFWPLDTPDATVRSLAAHLTAAEHARADGFYRPRDRDRFRVGRGRMRAILASYTASAPADLTFDLVGRDKPILAQGPAFNLSHAGGWAALAVAPKHRNLQLGIDIEARRPVEDALPVRVFSAREQAELAELPQAQWNTGFFNGWTRKEAVIKATGAGFGADLRGFSVSLDPGKPAKMLESLKDLPRAEDWALMAIDTGPEVFCALAAVTKGAPLGPITVREGEFPLTAVP